MQRCRAFTLIEIVITVFILMLVLLLAVPSLNGVLADKRLRRSLEGFNNLVRQAQERSVAERRAYLIVWRDKEVVLRPEVFAKDEQGKVLSEFVLSRGDVLKLTLPAALTKILRRNGFSGRPARASPPSSNLADGTGPGARTTRR